MKTYDLYLDSGPMKKKTYVQVPELTGCIARGDTTDEAVANAGEAIRTYLRFLARNGERVKVAEPFDVRVAHHRLDGAFPGNGVGFLATDREPLPVKEAERLMKRLDAMHQAVRAIVAPLNARRLDAKPSRGRPIRDILRHMCVEGAYLRGVPGASRIQRLVERRELDALDALDQLHALELERLRAMPEEQRSAVVMRGQQQWSARAAVRRMLEHCWEHYTEIAARLGAQP